MRLAPPALNYRVAVALVALVALGSGAMGLVLSAGLHAVGVHRGPAAQASGPTTSPYDDGSVVVPPRQQPPARAAAEPTPPAPARTVHAVAVTPVSLSLAPRVAPPAAPSATPTLPPATGLDGGGLQPANGGQPTPASRGGCADATAAPSGDGQGDPEDQGDDQDADQGQDSPAPSADRTSASSPGTAARTAAVLRLSALPVASAAIAAVTAALDDEPGGEAAPAANADASAGSGCGDPEREGKGPKNGTHGKAKQGGGPDDPGSSAPADAVARVD